MTGPKPLTPSFGCEMRYIVDETPNPNFQIPNPKRGFGFIPQDVTFLVETGIVTVERYQYYLSVLVIEIWILEFLWYLLFGIWYFRFRILEWRIFIPRGALKPTEGLKPFCCSQVLILSTSGLPRYPLTRPKNKGKLTLIVV